MDRIREAVLEVPPPAPVTGLTRLSDAATCRGIATPRR
jgi:hypothetical protein